MDRIHQLRALVEQLRTKRSGLIAQRQTIRDAVAARPEDQRDLTETEAPEYARLQREIADVSDELTDAIVDLNEALDQEARERGASSALRGLGGGTVEVRSEPLTYERGNGNSYFRDLAMATVTGDGDARGRLVEHRSQMDVEIPRLERQITQSFERAMAGQGVMDYTLTRQQQRDVTGLDGSGGEFIPPLWLMSEWAEYARAGRAIADTLRVMPLPGGTNSISLPRLTGGASTASQTAPLAPVEEQDPTSDSVTAHVETIAGQVDVPLQLLEQSPMNMDEIYFADLTGDYNQTFDYQLINGRGHTFKELLGMLRVSGVTALTYTDGSPTVPEFWPYGAKLVSKVETARNRPVTHFAMHGRRWMWMVGTLDGQNRPFVVMNTAQGAQNTLLAPNGNKGEGVVGDWHGVDAVKDLNMPTTLGAGTEDAVLAYRAPDLLAWEGALRTRALPEPLGDRLGVRLQVYRYVAFMPDRYPAGIGTLTGTGLAAPAEF